LAGSEGHKDRRKFAFKFADSESYTAKTKDVLRFKISWLGKVQKEKKFAFKLGGSESNKDKNLMKDALRLAGS